VTLVRPRHVIAASAASRLAAADFRDIRVVVGFDGFVDAIIELVDRRDTMRQDDYHRLTTITAFAARAAAAAGKSANLEVVVKERRFGGNGPLMAGGLASLGMATSYIGCIAADGSGAEVDPLFVPFADRCRASGGRVLPVAPPAHTDAFEFLDGKIMFNNPAALYGVTWEQIERVVGAEVLEETIASAALIGVVNWTIMASVPDIWRGLRSILRKRGVSPRVFIDLSDPAKRTDGDITVAMADLKLFNANAPVTLGLNLSEAMRIDRVCDAGAFSGDGAHATGQAVALAAAKLRVCLELDTVVIHPREGAGAATAGAGPLWFDGPLVREPRLSTGAGDHFNAGFAFGQVCGLPLDECLATGCGVSGAYVRDAQSPSRDRLIAFLNQLPLAED